ncbi:hypothetical protein DFH08DRAFT_965050 [Mycena albidolilacea]|uniref:Ribonuclease H1 N-terminal domain-containing protein n=1 Tax=Mycena albidolilacea TaxID=1033008 RepID=A0AAD6ZRM5_9AGAR|nr:hypothetical protein DFH08DRAFT_965050 [Mycena albidolilacea]
MSSPYRCEPPFHPDPGQSEDVPSGKLYLVCGRCVKQPGVYSSWPSADAQYMHVPGATVKRYWDYRELRAAWHARCELGEHDHLPHPHAVRFHLPAARTVVAFVTAAAIAQIPNPQSLPATHSIASLTHPVTHATRPIAPS